MARGVKFVWNAVGNSTIVYTHIIVYLEVVLICLKRAKVLVELFTLCPMCGNEVLASNLCERIIVLFEALKLTPDSAESDSGGLSSALDGY